MATSSPTCAHSKHKQTCEQMTHYLPFQKCERGIKNKHLCILIRRQLKVRRSRTDLPVDGLFQGQTVRSSCGSGSEFCVINVVRLSVKLQSTKHTCGTTTQTHTHLVSPKTCNTTQYIHVVLVQRFIAVTVAVMLCFSCF